MRVSPTWAMVATPFSMRMTLATQPMPCRSWCDRAMRTMRSFAASRPRAGSPASSRACRASSAAVRPALSPPMPSITANRPRSGRQTNASSFSARTVPRSVRAAAHSARAKSGPVRSAARPLASAVSIALNAVDGEFHLSVGEGHLHGELVYGDLAALLHEAAGDLDGVGARETADDHAAAAHLDPELPLVDLARGAGQGHEPGRGGLVWPAQHDARAARHRGRSLVPLHAQARA